MADWIRDGLKREEAAAQHQQQQDSLQLHRAGIIKAKAQAFFNTLVSAVETDVQNHASEAPPDKRFAFTRRPRGEFAVSRQYFPASEMVCALDEPAAQVIAKGSIVLSRDTTPRTWERTWNIGVDQNDSLYLVSDSGKKYASMADVSRDMLEPVLFPS